MTNWCFATCAVGCRILNNWMQSKIEPECSILWADKLCCLETLFWVLLQTAARMPVTSCDPRPAGRDMLSEVRCSAAKLAA